MLKFNINTAKRARMTDFLDNTKCSLNYESWNLLEQKTASKRKASKRVWENKRVFPVNHHSFLERARIFPDCP